MSRDPSESTVSVELRPDASRPVVGVLIGLEGELVGEVHPVRAGENRIGRAAECEIRLMSPFVSKRYAQIESFESAFSLRWLSEKNPPKVNGQEVGRDVPFIRDGDLLTLGRTVYSFRTARKA